MNTATMFSRKSDEWTTPDSLFSALDYEFGFVVDAAATEDNTKCQLWFDDALNDAWYADSGPYWLNPPYSQCRAFIAKAASAAEHGATVVCLVPSRTDTRWWHDYVWDGNAPRPGVEVRFIKGRLKFGDSANSAPFPSVIVIFRPCQTN